jgi:hypothetical protein
MKCIGILALALLAASVARADTIVSVSLNPFDFGHQISFTGQDLGSEILAATFTWDTTTGMLSNIVVAASGPFQPVPYSRTLSLGGPGDIWFLSWQLTDNAIYSLNYGLHSLGGSPGLSSTPGVHYTNSNINLWCACMTGDQDAFGDTATVTAISNDPVSTPEPSTLMLLGFSGLLGFLVKFSR